MSEAGLDLELQQLGETLKRATARDLQRDRTFPLRGRAIAVAAAVAVVLSLAGVGIAAGLLKTTRQEQHGLLSADATFAGTQPTCMRVAPDEFHCVLASLPTGLTVVGSYRDTKVATVDAQNRIDGGCVSTSDNGRVWECYLGRLAVQHGAIDSGLLGQTRTSPAHG
jgi:hypothetical protein